jgi:hypothetical protein
MSLDSKMLDEMQRLSELLYDVANYQSAKMSAKEKENMTIMLEHLVIMFDHSFDFKTRNAAFQRFMKIWDNVRIFENLKS